MLHPLYSLLDHPPTTAIYTLSLHDALPIWAVPGLRAGRVDDGHQPQASGHRAHPAQADPQAGHAGERGRDRADRGRRSEEHTSELQSHVNLVCRLLLEKKKKKKKVLTLDSR